MSEPKTREFEEVEIDQIAGRLFEWALRQPHPDRPIIGFGFGDPLTPVDLAEAVKQRSPAGMAFLRVLRYGGEVESLDSILDAFEHSC